MDIFDILRQTYCKDYMYLLYCCYICVKGILSLNFAEMIKFVRRKSLLSQADFAQAVGVSFSTVNRWENGKAIPQLCKLKRISDFCIEQNIAFDIEKFITDFESDHAGTE